MVLTPEKYTIQTSGCHNSMSEGKKLELDESRCLIMHQPQQQQQKRRCQNSNKKTTTCVDHLKKTEASGGSCSPLRSLCSGLRWWRRFPRLAVPSLRRQIRERWDMILVAMIWMVTIVYWSLSMLTHDDAVWMAVSKEMEIES